MRYAKNCVWEQLCCAHQGSAVVQAKRGGTHGGFLTLSAEGREMINRKIIMRTLPAETMFREKHSIYHIVTQLWQMSRDFLA